MLSPTDVNAVSAEGRHFVTMWLGFAFRVMAGCQVLWGECIAGALYNEDFKRIARDVGFADPRVLSVAPITVDNAELQNIIGEAKFYSITYRYGSVIL